MSVLLAVSGFDPARWLAAFGRHAPHLRVATEPAALHDPAIRYAVVWKQPAGLLSSLPNLKAVFSLGAGVDHVLADPTLPDLPVVRVVAPDLTARMSEYVVWRVLDHFRRGASYRQNQAQGLWHERVQPAAGAVTVGIMGLGELGRNAARKLRVIGFSVAGWSRTEKSVEGVECFAGAAGLDAFLGRADILVALLPDTSDTRGLLAAPLFAKLKRATPLGEPPVLINAGRGSLQNERDILAALEAGRLSEASLDVFETEPLPAASPLWRHPRVFVTPHAAAVSDPDALAPIIAAQIDAAERGEPLRHVVDREAGY